MITHHEYTRATWPIENNSIKPDYIKPECFKEVTVRLLGDRLTLELFPDPEALFNEYQFSTKYNGKTIEWHMAAPEDFIEEQIAKAGYVYIISNEGSFGQNVYKIGMTRRLKPLDRIHELSSASVPFPFDVHALIWSEDAPALENMLHKKFALSQVNKVNFRKEFFRLSLSEIRSELEKSGLNIKWTITAETSEYRETLAIEKAIQNNPQAREDWLNHQLEIEYNTEVFNEDSQEGA